MEVFRCKRKGGEIQSEHLLCVKRKARNFYALHFRSLRIHPREFASHFGGCLKVINLYKSFVGMCRYEGMIFKQFSLE